MQKGLRIKLSKSDLYRPDRAGALLQVRYSDLPTRQITVGSMKVPKFFEALKKTSKVFLMLQRTSEVSTEKLLLTSP